MLIALYTPVILDKFVPIKHYNAKFVASGCESCMYICFNEQYLVRKCPMQGVIVIQFDSIVLTIRNNTMYTRAVQI